MNFNEAIDGISDSTRMKYRAAKNFSPFDERYVSFETNGKETNLCSS